MGDKGDQYLSLGDKGDKYLTESRSMPNMRSADPSNLSADHAGAVPNGGLGADLGFQLNAEEKWPSIRIERPVLTQTHFDEMVPPDQRYSKTLRERFASLKNQCECSAECTKSFLYGKIPFIKIMKDYNPRTDALNDFLSGLTVGIMQIPQGMSLHILNL